MISRAQGLTLADEVGDADLAACPEDEVPAQLGSGLVQGYDGVPEGLA